MFGYYFSWWWLSLCHLETVASGWSCLNMITKVHDKRDEGDRKGLETGSQNGVNKGQDGNLGFNHLAFVMVCRKGMEGIIQKLGEAGKY